MLFTLRTIGAGVGVLALCFAMASLSWQYLLLGFALASVAWACYSCSNQLRPRKRDPQQMAQTLAFDGQRRRRLQPDNVYAFPPEWGNQTMLN